MSKNESDKEIVAIIPARGKSKQLPGKNLKLLNGKPLIAYSIEAALKCKYIGKVVVSTEDSEIEKISKQYGAAVIKRPEEFARDDSPTIDATKHAVETLQKEEKYNPAALVLLQPTSPLRTLDDLNKAIELFLSSGCKNVVSVCETEKSPYWSLKIKDGQIEPLLGRDYFNNKRRQALPKTYAINGAIYITTIENLYRQNSFFDEETVAYVMSNETSTDIDRELDFEIAEFLMKKRKIQNQHGLEIEIAGKKIGKGQPCFIIAEAGINHNADMGLAKKLIDAAKEAGADAVKFQTHLAENEMLEGEATADYVGEPFFNLVKRMELTKGQHIGLMDYCKEKGILFLSTGYCKEAVDLLDELGLPAFKVGSGEVTNLPLIGHIAKKGKPMIVSTGMTAMGELRAPIDVIKKANVPLILLQCTSTYPTKYHDVQLKGIRELRKEFGVPVGFSDHSMGIYMPIAAVALGACVVEKHFTMDKNLPGPDHKASIEPQELKELVKGIRAVESAMKKSKIVLEEEKGVQGFARHSVVSAVDIPAETVVNRDMLGVKRPGTGIPAREIDKIVGKKAKNAIKANALIKWDDFY